MNEDVMMLFHFIIVPLLLLLVFLIMVAIHIYQRFHHYKWSPNSTPDENATFVNMEHATQISFLKICIKTTVFYSDGFIFTTYLANYDHLDYELQREIKILAGQAHMKAVKKHLAKELKHKS